MNETKEYQRTVYHSPTYGHLALDGMLDRMIAFQYLKPDAGYRLLIGTDSMPGTGGEAMMVTAMVLQRVGNGGLYFWKRERYRHLMTLRQRMVQEALCSVEHARTFLAHRRATELLIADLEIHVDIGHRGPTREMIKEIVGMVTAHGFPVKTKPHSVAASSIADRHTVPAFP